MSIIANGNRSTDAQGNTVISGTKYRKDGSEIGFSGIKKDGANGRSVYKVTLEDGTQITAKKSSKDKNSDGELNDWKLIKYNDDGDRMTNMVSVDGDGSGGFTVDDDNDSGFNLV